MEQYFEEIKKCPLFANIEETDLLSLLHCLQAKKTVYQKGQLVFGGEGPAEHAGVVLSGCVHIVQEDYWGNRTILASIRPHQLFGEALAYAGAKNVPFMVFANEQTTVLHIDYRRIVTTCSASCLFHTKLISNMLSVLAQKNMMLTRKMEHVTKRTIKEKVLSFLSEQAMLANSDRFSIPFNRQELADYLSVERSALSSVLSKMKEEGLIDFRKNHFRMM